MPPLRSTQGRIGQEPCRCPWSFPNGQRPAPIAERSTCETTSAQKGSSVLIGSCTGGGKAFTAAGLIGVEAEGVSELHIGER